MFSYHSNYFKVVINMSQVPIDLSPSPLPHARMGGLLNCSTVYEGRARAEKQNFLVKTVQKMPFLACLFKKKNLPSWWQYYQIIIQFNWHKGGFSYYV